MIPPTPSYRNAGIHASQGVVPDPDPVRLVEGEGSVPGGGEGAAVLDGRVSVGSHSLLESSDGDRSDESANTTMITIARQ